MAGNLMPDANGCVYYSFSVENVKQLNITQSGWFNGSLSGNPELAGIPLSILINDCNGENITSLNQTFRNVQRQPIQVMNQTCQCIEVYVGMDALTAARWVAAVETGGFQINRENFLWDVGIETCSPCED